jgi:hypothetical protein
MFRNGIGHVLLGAQAAVPGIPQLPPSLLRFCSDVFCVLIAAILASEPEIFFIGISFSPATAQGVHP